MPNAFFIDQTYLKDNSPLAANIDIEEIYPFAKAAEDKLIAETVGSCLYDRLIESLNASPQDYTSDEATLMRKIRDCLVWYTPYEALPFLSMKIRPLGVVKQSSENITNVDTSELSYLRKSCKDNGDHYKKLLLIYLCENSSLFPEYNCSGCQEIIPITKMSNTSDLAIDRNCDDADTDFMRKWLR